MLSFLREFGLQRRYGPPVIVVSGLPRSGTSMMMNMLTAAGLEIVTDRVRSADEDNPKGYFEDERVKDLAEMDDKSWVADCRGKVIKVVSSLLMELPADSRYKVIFMRRDLEEVLASQNKMLARRGEPVGTPDEDEKMMQRYRMHLRKIEFLLEEEKNYDRLDVGYRDVIESPREQAARVCRFLGLDADPAVLAGAVDRTLYRNRAEKVGSR